MREGPQTFQPVGNCSSAAASINLCCWGMLRTWTTLQSKPTVQMFNSTSHRTRFIWLTDLPFHGQSSRKQTDFSHQLIDLCSWSGYTKYWSDSVQCRKYTIKDNELSYSILMLQYVCRTNTLEDKKKYAKIVRLKKTYIFEGVYIQHYPYSWASLINTPRTRTLRKSTLTARKQRQIMALWDHQVSYVFNP